MGGKRKYKNISNGGAQRADSTKGSKSVKKTKQNEPQSRVDTCANDNRFQEMFNERENVNCCNVSEENKGIKCSGRTDKHEAFLNDELKSQTSRPEDEEERKRSLEDENKRFEENDDRCENEVNIEINNLAIRDLELLLDEIRKLSVADKQQTFRPFNDDSFPWIYRRAIANMHPTKKKKGLSRLAVKKIKELKSRPSKIIPKLLEQLKIRKQELEENKRKLYLKNPKKYQVLERENLVKRCKEASQLSSEVQLQKESNNRLVAENKKLAEANATLETEKKELKEKYDGIHKDFEDSKKKISSLKGERKKLLEYVKDLQNLLNKNRMSTKECDLKEVNEANESIEQIIEARNDTAFDPNEQLLNLKESPNGKLAVQIFNIIAYLKAEPIRRDFFYELLFKFCSLNHFKALKDVNKQQINDAVKLLECNSLLFIVKADGDPNQELIKVEPDAQTKRRSFLASDEKEENTLEKVLLLLRVSQEENFPKKCVELAVNVWPVAWNYPNLVQRFSRQICEMVTEMMQVEKEKGLIDQGIEFGNNALKKLKEVLGENHLQCFQLQLNISLVFYIQGKLEEAAKILKELAGIVKESSYGEGSSIFKHIQVLLSSVLAKLGTKNFEEALVLQQNCFEKCKEEFGEHYSKMDNIEKRDWKEKYDDVAKIFKNGEPNISKVGTKLEASKDRPEFNLIAERNKLLLKYMKDLQNLLKKDRTSDKEADLIDLTEANGSNQVPEPNNQRLVEKEELADANVILENLPENRPEMSKTAHQNLAEQIINECKAVLRNEETLMGDLEHYFEIVLDKEPCLIMNSIPSVAPIVDFPSTSATTTTNSESSQDELQRSFFLPPGNYVFYPPQSNTSNALNHNAFPIPILNQPLPSQPPSKNVFKKIEFFVDYSAGVDITLTK